MPLKKIFLFWQKLLLRLEHKCLVHSLPLTKSLPFLVERIASTHIHRRICFDITLFKIRLFEFYFCGFILPVWSILSFRNPSAYYDDICGICA